MQNKYAGDIGDYGKLGLLRFLHAAGLTVGVNWYLTPDEDNTDGIFTEYPKYRHCDEPLYCVLQQIVAEDRRKIASLENNSILHAVFYSKPLAYTGETRAERSALRQAWYEASLAQLRDVNVVFVDPDNGLLVPSAEKTRRDNKYVTPEELAGYYRQGATVIYYQHKARRKDQYYIDQHKSLMLSGCFPGAIGLGLKFHPVSQRYYFFLIQPEHYAMVRTIVDRMLDSPWGQGDCPAYSELKEA